ncbi:hypothetical protein SS05631_c04890 [Sinorhizobium sp. CCBAU 05631]|uniref:Uncharacterized protein n=2 Tax=Sinorhizobium TaxID=28105 RepID=A0A2S3YHX9_9HYPH|nr:hypothetical protein SS05631_c04890 [Sinorhizobium sp. CCBAU 05631]AUX75391.1 hypothetical protein NXT3_CH00794 [Sinorhizobium fredii]PDT40761.1 hypothetical protein CO656_15690 [Sinorhizobium sp. FG01]PDT52146.1 hypothetical protein CO664_14980 [Sinorhizobium sp. NG07B]POH26360.1 hypothetical protein ATY31_25390 [Sinorhizobium americanum]
MERLHLGGGDRGLTAWSSSGACRCGESRVEDVADRMNPGGAAWIATQAEQSAGWSAFAGLGQWLRWTQ